MARIGTRRVLFGVSEAPSITVDLICNAADGFVSGADAVYSTARATANGHAMTTQWASVGQKTATYGVYRTFLLFDTSSIPDGATIKKVNLKLTVYQDYSTTDFNVIIKKQDWSAQRPIATATREAAYDNCLTATPDISAWGSSSGVSAGTQYASGDMDTTWINKTGFTYYSLLSENDLNNVAPTDSEFLNFYMQDAVTAGQRPILTVAYSV